MEKLECLNRLLDDLEEHIDLDHLARVEELQYRATHFQEVPYLPLTVYTADSDFEKIPLEIAYDDPEKMLYNELLSTTMKISAYNSVKMKDDSPLMVRSNHGVGIIASMFGCNSRIFNNTMPWVDEITLEQARKTISNGIPDTHGGLGGKVLDTMKYYHERLSDYPKCSQAIHVTQPDLQGPFDILHLIIGNEAFYQVYDDPDFLHEALTVICDTFVRFRNEAALLANDAYKDSFWIHGFCCGGSVLTKNDTASANLSPAMFSEFDGDYCKKIYDSFTCGGSFHSCGKIKGATRDRIAELKPRCINYGNPEKHNLEEEYDFWSANGTAIMGWGYLMGYDELKIPKHVKTGISLICKADTIEQGKELLNRHHRK